MKAPDFKLKDIPQELITEARNNLLMLLAEANPELDAKKGAIYSLLVAPASILYAALQMKANRIRDSLDLKKVAENPQLADVGMVEALLSNFHITADPGSRASGKLMLIFTERQAINIPAKSVFVTEAGRRFQSTITTRSRVSKRSVVSKNDGFAEQNASGKYELPIEATAVDTGAIDNIISGTRLTSESQFPTLIYGYAASDFTGGSDASTLPSMLAQFSKLTAGAASE